MSQWQMLKAELHFSPGIATTMPGIAQAYLSPDADADGEGAKNVVCLRPDEMEN